MDQEGIPAAARVCPGDRAGGRGTKAETPLLFHMACFPMRAISSLAQDGIACEGGGQKTQ